MATRERHSFVQVKAPEGGLDMRLSMSGSAQRQEASMRFGTKAVVSPCLLWLRNTANKSSVQPC